VEQKDEGGEEQSTDHGRGNVEAVEPFDASAKLDPREVDQGGQGKGLEEIELQVEHGPGRPADRPASMGLDCISTPYSPAKSGRCRRVQRFTLSSLVQGSSQRAYIVVADEKPVLLEMMVRTLRAADHCVFQASDGQAAFELALSLQDINLLITNTQMPGMNGPELIRRVREILPTLPILYIKNKAPNTTAPGRLPPDIPILSEPFTAEQLLGAVKPLLQRVAGSI
jgi:CheY-like chemotaxis protein